MSLLTPDLWASSFSAILRVDVMGLSFLFNKYFVGIWSGSYLLDRSLWTCVGRRLGLREMYVCLQIKPTEDKIYMHGLGERDRCRLI